MKITFMKTLVLSAALTAAGIADAASNTITLDANSSLENQGWRQMGGIAPTVRQIGGKKILVFDDTSTTESSGCIYTIPEKMVEMALEKGFVLTFTMRWEGKPLPHNIELLLGDRRIFLALNNTPKEQAVVVLGYGENVGGKVSRPDRFHTWKLISPSRGATELHVDGKKVADVINILPSNRNRKTGSLGIGGVHGLSKERTGRLEVESVTFEILD
jgi:hypothetical protein